MVSIIIPVYNGAQTIERCLQSVLCQSYKDIEVIVVDDGSSDTTADKIKKYINTDSRIRYIFQKNQGVSVARNTGIDNANGEYLVFLDADDEYLPDSIQVLLNNLITYNVDLVIGSIKKTCNSRIIYCTPIFLEDHGKIYQGTELERLRRWNLERNPNELKELPCTDNNFRDKENAFRLGSPWARIYKRSCIGTIRFKPHLSMSEDLIFNDEILHRTNRVLIIDQIVYIYHDKPTTKRIYNRKAKDAYLMLAIELNKIKTKYDSAYEIAIKKRIMLCCWAGIKLGIIPNKSESIRQKMRTLKQYISNEPYGSSIRSLKFNDFNRKIDWLKNLIMNKSLYILLFFIR